MSERSFDRVALIGIGLIGSSLARALRRDSPSTSIVACARRSETLATVRRLELADETTDDPAEAAAGADLVVIATPLSAYAEIGQRIGPALKLGAILTASGAIDQRTLDRARRVAAETGGRLDQVLTQLGLVSERGLAEALSQLIGAPPVALADYPEAPLFLDRLKPKFLRRARALPIATTGDRTTIAMVDPLDAFTRNAVAAALGHAVAVGVAVPIELEAAFDRLYPADIEDGNGAGAHFRLRLPL